MSTSHRHNVKRSGNSAPGRIVRSERGGRTSSSTSQHDNNWTTRSSERSTRSERASGRSFHRIKTIDGGSNSNLPALQNMNKRSSNTTTGSSGGGSSGGGGDLSLALAAATAGLRSPQPSKNRPRRASSLRYPLSKSASMGNPEDRPKKGIQRSSTFNKQKPRAMSTTAATSLHNMELFAGLDASLDNSSSANNNNTTTNRRRTSMTNLTTATATSSNSAPTSVSSNLNASWDATKKAPPLEKRRNSLSMDDIMDGSDDTQPNRVSLMSYINSTSSHNRSSPSNNDRRISSSMSFSGNASSSGANAAIAKMSSSQSQLNASISGGMMMMDGSMKDHSTTSFVPSSHRHLRNSMSKLSRSSRTAKQFLADDSEDADDDKIESFHDEFSSSFRTSNSGGSGDSQYYQRRRQQNSSHHQQRRSGTGTSSHHQQPQQNLLDVGNASVGSGAMVDESMVDESFATDLEWNPEVQKQQYNEWRKFRQADDLISSESTTQLQRNNTNSNNNCIGNGDSNHTTNQWKERRDLRDVDQTVNLMDVSSDDYLPSSSSRRPPRNSIKDNGGGGGVGFMSKFNNSMVDVWLDKSTSDVETVRSGVGLLADGGGGVGRGRSRRGGKKTDKQRGGRKKKKWPYSFFPIKFGTTTTTTSREDCSFCSNSNTLIVFVFLLGLLGIALLVLIKMDVFQKGGASVSGSTSMNDDNTTTMVTTTLLPTTTSPTIEPSATPTIAPTLLLTPAEQQDIPVAAAVISGSEPIATNEPTTTPNNSDQQDGEEEVSSVVAQNQLASLLEKLNMVRSSSRLSQANPPSPQYLALHWVSDLGPDLEGVLGTPNHKLVHPPQDPEAAGEEDSDGGTVTSSSGIFNTMTSEESIRLVAYALGVLYFSTNGDTAYDINKDPSTASAWRKSTNWMQPAPICQWHGVTCEENPLTDSTVISHLNLTNNLLQGTLPEEVFQILLSLQVLDLSANRLTGTLPHDVSVTPEREDDLATKPSSLEFLWLGDNKFDGTIPTSWGRSMPKLKDFQLQHNQLSGHLPNQINHLASLRFFSVHNNQLSGKFPYIEGLQSLEYLYFYNNDFTNSLPYEIFRIPSMIDLRGQNNQMSGTIPPELENLRKLEILRLGFNSIEGSLPDIFDRLPNLSQIHLQSNKFEGPIPKTFGALSLLERLQIDTNHFTGTIPPELSNLKRLRQLKCEDNNLNGPMPPSVCDLKEYNELKFVAVDCDKVTDCTCCNRC